jgi:DnaK suppressor protein
MAKVLDGNEAVAATPLSDDELAYFKNLIEQKLSKSNDQLERMRQRLVNAQEEASTQSSYSLHMADVGTDSMEREKLSLMIAREKKYKEYLERALDRIADKTYGICKVTGKAIPKERLEAVPHTEISIEAKNAQQRR